MRVDCALLCDAVTTREGLLHILGGGVTRLNRPSFPAPLGVALALRIMVHPTEADRSHAIEARLLTEDGEQIGIAEVAFEVALSGEERPGEELAVATALSLQNVPLPDAGAYSFELLIDGVHQASVPFVAQQRSSQLEPEPGPDR